MLNMKLKHVFRVLINNLKLCEAPERNGNIRRYSGHMISLDIQFPYMNGDPIIEADRQLHVLVFGVENSCVLHLWSAVSNPNKIGEMNWQDIKPENWTHQNCFSTGAWHMDGLHFLDKLYTEMESEIQAMIGDEKLLSNFIFDNASFANPNNPCEKIYVTQERIAPALVGSCGNDQHKLLNIKLAE